MLYTVRTTSGREDIVIDMIETKMHNENIDIKSVVHPAEIKGYVFVEGNLAHVHKAIQGLMHVRGIIEKPVRLEEIQRFLEYKKTRITIELGDVVEIVGGSFKAEKGKVTRIDSVKGEVTIELLEASIPIPVTIATEFVKVIKRAKPEKTEEKPKPQMEEIRREEPERERTLGTELEEEIEEQEEKIKEEPEEAEAELSEEEEEESERKTEEEAKEEETKGEAEAAGGETAEKEATEQSEELESEKEGGGLLLEELEKEEKEKKKKKGEEEEFE